MPGGGGSDRTVLVLVRDVLGAGLLASLVEAVGREPAFPFENERADLAVERIRPDTVLLEGHHPAARSSAFFSAIQDTGARLVLFAPADPWEDVAEIARRPEVTAFVHPEPDESLAELLRRALTT